MDDLLNLAGTSGNRADKPRRRNRHALDFSLTPGLAAAALKRWVPDPDNPLTTVGAALREGSPGSRFQPLWMNTGQQLRRLAASGNPLTPSFALAVTALLANFTVTPDLSPCRWLCRPENLCRCHRSGQQPQRALALSLGLRGGQLPPDAADTNIAMHLRMPGRQAGGEATAYLVDQPRTDDAPTAQLQRRCIESACIDDALFATSTWWRRASAALVSMIFAWHRSLTLCAKIEGVLGAATAWRLSSCFG